MRNTFIILSFLSLVSFSGKSSVSKVLKHGNYTATMQLTDEASLQFTMYISIVDNGKCVVEVQNAQEHIIAEQTRLTKDSLIVDMPVFQSSLYLKILDKKHMLGVWHNRMKGDYTIPVSIHYGTPEASDHELEDAMEGRWKVTFGPGSEHQYMAIGVFNKVSSHAMEGTFMTETGDYRFLSGGSTGENTARLGCFDGSHAFLFNFRRSGDSLYGSFFSGKHWKDEWVAVKDDAGSFQLTDPDQLTKVVNEAPFKFAFPDLDSNLVEFPSAQFQDKVTIVQIMGSWCPNCMDETAFLTDLYHQYRDQGLEIISVSFEIPENFDGKVASVQRIVDHFNITYPVLIGGGASKKLASEMFPQLNRIISFPTAIFIDKNGEVRKVHTGFTGPGTGDVYESFRTETLSFVQELLKE